MFANEPTGNFFLFFSILLLKKDAQLVNNDDREQGLNFEYFSGGLCYRSFSQNIIYYDYYYCII